MKRLMLCMTVLLGSMTLFAQNFTTSAESMRKAIKDGLSSRGITVENSDDGSLKIIKNSSAYHIFVTENDGMPLFVQFFREEKYSDKITRSLVMKNINDSNSIVGVKVSCRENAVRLCAELFVGEATDFTSVYDCLVGQIDMAYKRLSSLK